MLSRGSSPSSFHWHRYLEFSSPLDLQRQSSEIGITDLTPLRGMPLEQIHLTPKNISRGPDILRAMRSLKTIGIGNQSWSAAEFWERYDKEQLKQ